MVEGGARWYLSVAGRERERHDERAGGSPNGTPRAAAWNFGRGRPAYQAELSLAGGARASEEPPEKEPPPPMAAFWNFFWPPRQSLPP